MYRSQTNKELWSSVGIIGKYYTTNENSYSTYDNNFVCSFDVDEETSRNEPWTGTSEDFKENLDAFLHGTTFNYPSGSGSYTYSNFINTYKSKKFTESLGEYTYIVTGTTTSKTKRVIIYQLVN